MRASFTCIVFTCIFVSNSLQAQYMFAPPGSEWYHNIGDGSLFAGTFHSYYAGEDTLVGISCRKVVRHAIPLSYLIYDLPTLYFYNTNDTVFVYNNLFNRFTPLYVFNVHDGDTVRLPVLPTETQMLYYGCSDSTFSFIVDSVRMVTYDTATLKTVYTRSFGSDKVSNETGYMYSYGNDSLGIYAERIGGISIGLMTWCMACANILTDEAQEQDSLRCYNDSTLSIKLTSGLCDIPIPPAAITAINKQYAINVFPNPANDVLNISIAGEKNPYYYSLYDIYGKVTIAGNAKNNTPINVSQLPPGMFILKVFIDNATHVYKQISILR